MRPSTHSLTIPRCRTSPRPSPDSNISAEVIPQSSQSNSPCSNKYYSRPSTGATKTILSHVEICPMLMSPAHLISPTPSDWPAAKPTEQGGACGVGMETLALAATGWNVSTNIARRVGVCYLWRSRNARVEAYLEGQDTCWRAEGRGSRVYGAAPLLH